MGDVTTGAVQTFTTSYMTTPGAGALGELEDEGAFVVATGAAPVLDAMDIQVTTEIPVVICLGDMPLVDGPAIDRIVAAYDTQEGRRIIVPTHQGTQGNPVLWDRAYIPELMTLSGDIGAKSLLKRHLESITEVEMPDNAVLQDFDTPESLP